MAHILFVISPQAGEIFPSFKIARDLKARGHRITYVGLPLNRVLDTEQAARAEGFEHLALFPDLNESSSPGSTLRQWLAFRRHVRQHMDAFAGRFLRGEMEAALRAVSPDLMVVDVMQPYAAMLAHKMGVPCVIYNNNCLSRYDPWVPPVNSLIVPTGTFGNRLKIRLIWRMVWTARAVFRRLFWNDGRAWKMIADHCGFPREKLFYDTEWWPFLDLPELVLLPEEFDVPRSRPQPPNRMFVESAVDTSRQGPEFPWERLDGRPLIYFALGSQFEAATSGWTRPWAAALRQSLLAAMAARPQWQMVAVVGEQARSQWTQLPENVITVSFAPQLKLLPRVSVMIGHAGLSSVKECIYFGVPMLMLPYWDDAPGTAARVAFHRIGLMAKEPKKVTTADFLASLDPLVNDPSFKQRVEAMGRRFRELEEQQAAANAIERCLRPAATARAG